MLSVVTSHTNVTFGARAVHCARSIANAFMILGTVIACSGGDGGGTTPVVVPSGTIVEGDGATAVAGDPVATNPAVKVTSSTGALLSGRTVTFAVTSGGGTATNTAQTTDAAGIARVGGWTLGPLIGANTMSATIAGATSSPLVFTVTGRAGAASAASKTAGDAQTGIVGSAVALRPSVRVVDRNGNVVSGATVTFAPAANSGTVTAGTVTTGADGVATVGTWTLGTVVGAQSLVATATGVSTTATFSATATAGAASLVTKQSGDAQTATVASAVTVAPSVKVTDAFGNVLAGQSVTFAIVSGAGTIAGATAITNTAGIATLGSWTLGTGSGAQAMQASVAGITTPVTFTATATAGAATQIVKQGGDAQTATVATLILVSPSVKVSDAFGNAVVGQAVTFTIATGAGALAGAATQTNALGVATVGGWTLGSATGVQTVNAVAAGVATSLTFSATAIPGPAAQLAKTAGDGQVASVNALLPVNLAVRVSDQFGNLISGKAVTFAIASGGGTLAGASPFTSNGIATVGGWTLGATTGTQSVQVSVDALTVLFTATATQLLNIAPFVGTYNGTWVNTTFGSTGTGSVTIANDATTRTATVTASATGNVLGTPGGVAPATRSNVYSTTTATFSGFVTPMGTINGTMDAAGNIVASGINVPNASISRWDATGTITATQLRLNFTVLFTSGAPATGTITFTKP